MIYSEIIDSKSPAASVIDRIYYHTFGATHLYPVLNLSDVSEKVIYEIIDSKSPAATVIDLLLIESPTILMVLRTFPKKYVWVSGKMIYSGIKYSKSLAASVIDRIYYHTFGATHLCPI